MKTSGSMHIVHDAEGRPGKVRTKIRDEAIEDAAL